MRFLTLLYFILGLSSAWAGEPTPALCSLIPLLPAGKPMLEDYRGEPASSMRLPDLEPYELHIGEDGLFYNFRNELFDTTGGSFTDALDRRIPTNRAIFVVSLKGRLLAEKNHIFGQFHHSTFLGGADVLVPGEFEIPRGVLTVVSFKSGHYEPELFRMRAFLKALDHARVNLHRVKVELAGLGHWTGKEKWQVSVEEFLEFSDDQMKSSEDFLLRILEKNADVAKQIDPVFYLLYHSKEWGAPPEAEYPSAYKPVVFEAFKRVFRDPRSREAAWIYLEANSNYAALDRRSPELDQALQELADELPEYRLRLLQVLNKRPKL